MQAAVNAFDDDPIANTVSASTASVFALRAHAVAAREQHLAVAHHREAERRAPTSPSSPVSTKASSDGERRAEDRVGRGGCRARRGAAARSRTIESTGEMTSGSGRRGRHGGPPLM